MILLLENIGVVWQCYLRILALFVTGEYYFCLRVLLDSVTWGYWCCLIVLLDSVTWEYWCCLIVLLYGATWEYWYCLWCYLTVLLENAGIVYGVTWQCYLSKIVLFDSVTRDYWCYLTYLRILALLDGIAWEHSVLCSVASAGGRTCHTQVSPLRVCWRIMCVKMALIFSQDLKQGFQLIGLQRLICHSEALIQLE